jgi:hypothetical protein
MMESIKLQARIASLAGKPCRSKVVGEYKSLALGFGEEVSRPTARNPLAVRSEWEIGTYTAAWRIVHGNEVLCGSMDPVKIEMTSRFDIRVVLSGESYVEFICASSDDDEIFHIFGPENFFAKYSLADGWTVND